MSDKQLIAETEHVSAIAQDLGGDVVFVTFNAMGVLRNGLEFWADRFFLKRGLSAIGVMSARPNWFPARDMAEIIAQIKRLIGNRRVVTYGHSQGGYGALKYARKLNASVTLAFCPQWSINPKDVAAFDPRYAVFFDHHLENGLKVEAEDLSAHSFVFFDSREYPDALNARQLMPFPGVATVAAPFSMHDTIRLITEGGGSGALIDACVQGIPNASDLRRIVRQCRRRSPTYHKHALSQLLQRLHVSSKRSTTFVSRALTLQTELSPFHPVLAARARHDEQATDAALAEITDGHFDNIDLIFLWNVCVRLRFLPMEYQTACQILTRYANSTNECLHAISTLIRMQQLDKAQAELQRLARQDDAMGFIGVFVDLGIKLQRADIVEEVLGKATSPAMEVPVRFRLVEFYRVVDDRPKAFRTLMRLAEFCHDRPDQLAVIASHLLAIGEGRYALELREKLQRLAPADINRSLDVIEARIPVHAQRAVSELQDLLRAGSLNAAQWERVSMFYEHLGLLKKALKAINEGKKLADGAASLQARKVYLLILLKRRLRARRELAASIGHPRADFFYLRVLADLALGINEYELAVQCAELQFRLAPHNPDAILYYTRCRRITGELTAARQQLSALLQHERRYPSLAEYQWIALTQELFDSGSIALAKEAALEVCARNPHQLTARQVLMKIALLEKHGTGGTLSGNRAAPAHARNRVGRFFAMWAPRRG